MKRFRNDDGSIVLSLFAVMIITGLLLVVASTVLMGQRNTRIDRDFEQALQVAEVGLSQLNSLVQSNPAVTPAELAALIGGADANGNPAVEGTTAEGQYVAFATRNADVWSVQSTGTSRDRTRTVRNELTVRPLFGNAAFGRLSIVFNGGNGADSFDSQLGTDICLDPYTYANPGTPTSANTSQTNVQMCPNTRPPNLQRPGSAATNGSLFLKGGVESRIEYAEIFNAKERITDPLPDATGWCEGNATTCDMYNQTPRRLVYHREPIELPAIRVCDGVASEGAFAGTGTLGKRAYGFTDVTLTGSTVFTGTVTQPTILCISGKLTVANQHLINFQQLADGRWVPRRPGSLKVFVTGASNSGVALGNNASISAAIYAPNASIDCGPQGNVYGSLIANAINNQGGWNFHYDDSLSGDMINAPVRIQNWEEAR